MQENSIDGCSEKRGILRRLSSGFEGLANGVNTMLRNRNLSISKPKLKHQELEQLRCETKFSFTEKELKRWYKKFMMENPSGKIGSEEITKLFKKRFKDGDPDDLVRDILRIFDTDNSGSLEFRELMVALSITMRGTADEKLKLAFNMVDRDGSGVIDRNEMLQLIQALHKLVGVTVSHISECEDTPESHTNDIMRKLTENCSCEINFEIFAEGVKREPGIAKLITDQVNADILCRDFTMD